MERVKPEIQANVNEALLKVIGQQDIVEFAKSIGVSRDTVNNWLRKKSDIRLNSLVRIAEVYGISTDYMLGLHDVPVLDQSKQEICSKTGLSEEALDNLTNLPKKVLSDVIASPSFGKLIEEFFRQMLYAAQADDLLHELRAAPQPGGRDQEEEKLSLESRIKTLKYGKYVFTEICGEILKDICTYDIDNLISEADKITNI